ncbi:Collagen alpha-2(I) chain [Nymphon striatum]|nr:Collagen alpha-2(I) chain [Nymphon striatum]
MNVVNGETYTVRTCGLTGWDTQLSLYDQNTANFVSYNDDACGSFQSETSFTATFTGQVRTILTQYSCNASTNVTQIEYFGTVSGPVLTFTNPTVNEFDATATFTVTHSGTDTGGAFTVVFNTVDGSATAGNDYTTTSGTLNFNASGDTEQITVPILDDTLYDGDENFTIQFTSVSDLAVDITGNGLGSIVDDEVILNNTDLVLVEEFDGYIGYTSTGGSLRTQDNNTNACSVTTSSSNTLTSSIPAAGTIDKAFLYWSHSGQTADTQVTFEGVTVDADLMYTSSAGSGRIFFGGVSDVTSIVTGIANPSTSFDFSGLSIDTSSTYCNSATVLGGASGSKTTVLSWEGDQTLSNNEDLEVTTGLGTFDLIGDGDNTLINRNPFNSSIYDNTGGSTVNITTTYGLDLDTYDVSPFITSGVVYEDLNYGGGLGRNLASAPGIQIAGVDMELYDAGGSVIQSTTTDATGVYVFGGMANGTYSIRAINNTISSSRGGGAACVNCIPVQTFKTDYIASSLVPDPNSVGGENPAGVDSAAGNLTGAQSVSEMTIFNEGVADASGMDIESNGIFNPPAGDDTSIFMIPPTSDPLGRAADANYTSGYFDILISSGNPLSPITGLATIIDGRTQTSYSGDTNTGSIGSGGTAVGTSGTLLPDFDLPEIQVHRDNGDVFQIQGDNDVVRNLSVYASNRTAILFDDGSGSTISNSLLGVNLNAGNVRYGVEIEGTTVTNMFVTDNYIATTGNAGVFVNGGTGAKTIQNNHIFEIGDSPCDLAIDIRNGSSGVLIQNNLIENSQGIGVKSTGPGSVTIIENSITGSGQNTSNCASNPSDYGISLIGDDSQIINNIIYNNGGAGLVVLDLNSDGVTLNDSGDTDAGPNSAINFPVISGVFATGANLVIEGWSRPGATIELFLTDINEGTATIGDNQMGLSTDYGEGQVYLDTFVEGSGSDTDNGSSTYTDDDSNTDNTNKFKFTITLPPGVTSGIAFAQTTVTLEDQCNCEVLSGIDVIAPGTITPAGADTGDIYVNTNTGTIYFWDGDSWELTSSDDQQLQNFTFDSGTIENGNTVTADLSALDQTAIDVDYDNTISGLTATDVQAAIDEINAASGTVALVDNTDGTYTFTNAAGGTVTITDTSISTLSTPVNGIYTYTDESGATQTIDTNASAIPYDNATSGLTATNVQTAIDEINAAAGTDESGATQSIDVNDPDAIIGNEVVNGTDATLTRSGAGTTGDPYTLDVSADGITNAEIADNAIQLENISDGTASGEVIQWDGTDWVLIDLGSVTVTELDGVIGNEVVNGTDGTLVRAGTGTTGDPYTLDIAADGITNAEIADNAVQLENVADGTTVGQIMRNGTNWVLVDGAGLSTDDQQLDDPNTAFNTGTNELTIALEDGGTATADLSSLDNSGTDDQIANEVNVTDTAGNFTATEVEGVLAELAAGSSDDQQLDDPNTAFNTGTNELTIALEDGGTATADLSSLNNSGTDDQIANEVNVTDTAGNFTATEVEGVLAELAAGSTDISGSSLSGTNLTIGIENGTNEVVNLSTLVGTDDQVANEVRYDNSTSGLTADQVQAAIDELANESTDDQNISGSGLSGTNLTIGIENGTNEVVNLSTLVGTDDQVANEVRYDNSTSGLTADQVQAAIDELATESTDDQDISTNDATLTRSGTGTSGSPYTLDVAADGITNAEIADNAIQLENIADGTASGEVIQWDGSDWVLVDLGSVTVTEVDGIIGNEVVNGTDGTLVRAGTGTTGDPYTLDIAADGITNGEIADNAIQLENVADGTTVGQIMQWNGTNWVLVDGAVGTDDQIANEVNVTDTAGNFTATEVEGVLAELAGQTDDDVTVTNIKSGNTIATISEPGITPVDINETITTLSTADNISYTYTSEDNTTTSFDGTDDQIANEVNVTDTAGNFTATNVEGALAELASGSTDDQQLNDTNTVFNAGTSELTIAIALEMVVPQRRDLSALDNTDNQQISLSGNILTLDNGTSTDTSVDLAPFRDDQNLTSAPVIPNQTVEIQIDNGTNTTIDLRDADADPTNEIELPNGGNSGQVLSTDAGADGNDGATGPQGPTGATGATGASATGASGPAGADGADGNDGATGAQGPAGPQGPAGTNGTDGNDGADGATGATGAQGPAGPQGPAGAQGPTGATGATGSQGPAGTNGTDGNDGATGPAGPTGPAGTNGTDGTDGAAGPQGPTGATGLTGPAGADGNDGATGPAGPQGPAGATGATGPTGATGAQGPAGTNNRSTGASGPAGADGADGNDGATGAQGPAGPQGPAGTNGTDGNDGADGATGATGAQGPAGPQGPAGAQGPTGATGATGSQGPAGTNGTDGNDGATGPAGPTGPAGTNGTDGADGAADGNDGADGATGPAGTNGTDGTDGATGPQGPTGLTGPAGADGNDGADGAVGPQGPTGATGATGPIGATGLTGPAGPQGPTGLTGPAGADGKRWC